VMLKKWKIKFKSKHTCWLHVSSLPYGKTMQFEKSTNQAVTLEQPSAPKSKIKSKY